MARAIWSGSLSFGLVSVPVELFSATEDKTIHFNQFQAGTADRIRNKRVNERTGDEVDYADIVKGYDLGGGEYVLVSAEELEAVEPGRSRNVEITDFVDLDAIDPVFYQKSYFLAPKGEQAERAYSLLRRTMEDAGKVAIATLVMRGKQYLVAVRPEPRALVLETMYFADEVRDPAKEVPGLPLEEKFSDRELATARLLVESMTAAWEPERYHDTYREQVVELIERKRSGQEVVVESHRAEPTKVVDLMAALEASVAAAGGGPGSPRGADEANGRSKGTRGASASRAKSKGRAPELVELSRAELYDRATALEIQGRSKMSRQELEQAVASAVASAGTPAVTPAVASAGGTRRRKAS